MGFDYEIDVLFPAIVDRLQAEGIRSRSLAMVVFAMALVNISYSEAVRYYSEWREEAPERIQAQLCLDVLRAGLEVAPELLAKKILEEVF